MSRQNWTDMVDTGIAGDFSVTCFVAAIDCLLPNKDIPYKTYAKYTEAFYLQAYFGPNRKHTRTVLREVLEAAIGSSSIKNLVCKRAADATTFANIVRSAAQSNKLIILHVTNSHVVGLQQTPNSDDLWNLVGNCLPTTQKLALTDFFQYLYIPRRNTKDISNIYLLSH